VTARGHDRTPPPAPTPPRSADEADLDDATVMSARRSEGSEPAPGPRRRGVGAALTEPDDATIVVPRSAGESPVVVADTTLAARVPDALPGQVAPDIPDDATALAHRSGTARSAQPDSPDDATVIAPRRAGGTAGAYDDDPDDATSVARRREPSAGQAAVPGREASDALPEQTRLRGARRRGVTSSAEPLPPDDARIAYVPDAGAAPARHAPRTPAAIVVPRTPVVPPSGGSESISADLARADLVQRSRRRRRLLVMIAVAVALPAAAAAAVLLLLL
jgi:hypothetical protein